MGWLRKVKEGEKRCGGLVFFTSLVFLWILALCNTYAIAALIEFSVLFRVLLIALGVSAGYLLARVAIGGKLAVFIHELKHSIISNLCGNRSKGMRLNRASGAFTYEYTERTRAYNAFIALAPYWFPAFQFVTFISVPWLLHEHDSLVLITAIAYGADLSLNTRDIAPHQTDFSNLRGGYGIGVAYVVGMNLVLSTIIAAWWLASIGGLHELILNLRHLVTYLLIRS